MGVPCFSSEEQGKDDKGGDFLASFKSLCDKRQNKHKNMFATLSGMLLCPLSRRLLWIFSSNLPGNLALKIAGDFWWIFSGLRFPRNEARKPSKNSGKIRSKIRAKFGTKIRKFGELSFCNFSDTFWNVSCNCFCRIWSPKPCIMRSFELQRTCFPRSPIPRTRESSWRHWGSYWPNFC